MSGSHIGGIRASITNKEKHGEDFYQRIGRKGGKKCGIKKGFALNPKLASIAGRKGGSISRRGKAKNDN